MHACGHDCHTAMPAATGAFEIAVKGKGGHGAMPHLTIDPVVCAAKMVVELQTIVSRETNPFAPTVVTVGSIHGGDAMNVIPGEVRMTGTFSQPLEGRPAACEASHRGNRDRHRGGESLRSGGVVPDPGVPADDQRGIDSFAVTSLHLTKYIKL